MAQVNRRARTHSHMLSTRKNGGLKIRSILRLKIGAGFVATKDVEPFAVVGGVPAKLLYILNRYHYVEKG